ncbi:hypothetical protein [Maribellus mangrovi]|uniref:hypothetical protein n=1 Tax=Maribellus mangrovi TaxID=3133146 RepID=UPI0030ECBF06
MKTKIVLFLVLSTLLTDNISAQSKLESAKDKYNNFNIIEAKKIYEEIWASSGSLNEKTEAGKQLVYINWKFYHDYELSKKYADSIIKLDTSNFDILLQIIDVSIQAKKFNDASQYLKMGFEKAKSENQIKELHIKYSDYTLLKSQNELTSQKTININDVKDALDKIETYYLNQPEDLQIVKLYLGLALILNDKEKIKDSWKVYFRIPQDKNVTGILAEAEINIDKGLQSKDSINYLAEGLAYSRFYDYAVMIINENSIELNQNPDLKDIYNYYIYLKDIEKLIFGYYRDKLFNHASDEKYLNDYYSLCIALWNNLDWGSNKPMFYEKAFEEELFKRFGAIINNGKGGNQIGFFVGHSVVNEKRSIEQYGRKTDLTYLSLDYIIGNIFPHWYFGFFGIGGWATTDNEVLQIREIYANMPVDAWYKITDKQKRANWERSINEKLIVEDSIATKNPYSILEGVSEKIKFNQYNLLLDSLKKIYKNEQELKIAFISTLERISVYSSIFCHESRHLLDSYKDYPNNSIEFSSEEKEFRAKLSELSFSYYPKLTFAEAILRYEGTAHENANTRIIKGIVDWMDINKFVISGLDKSKPLLPQLDLLTNKQIVQAIQNIDPLYAEYSDN